MPRHLWQSALIALAMRYAVMQIYLNICHKGLLESLWLTASPICQFLNYVQYNLSTFYFTFAMSILASWWLNSLTPAPAERSSKMSRHGSVNDHELVQALCQQIGQWRKDRPGDLVVSHERLIELLTLDGEECLEERE